MARITNRRTLMVLCTAAFAAGVLGASVVSPAGAGVQQPVTPATAPPAGSGVQIIVLKPQPVGPLSFT